MFNIDFDAIFDNGLLKEQTTTLTCDEKGWRDFVFEYCHNDDGTMWVKVGIRMFEGLIYLCPGIIQVRKNIRTTDNGLLDDAIWVGTQYVECDRVIIEREQSDDK